MLVHIDCDSLIQKITGGYVEVDCERKHKKCSGCKDYISVINLQNVSRTVKLTGLLKQPIKKLIK